MADKIVMGYWDCPYCNTKGIQGTIRDCPNCGKPRSTDTKFYMKSQSHDEIVKNHEYLSEEQAAKKGKGADWMCSYCGSYNSATDTVCIGCGHERDEEDVSYFDLQKERSSNLHKIPDESNRFQNSRQEKTPVRQKPKKRLLIGAGILFLILFMVYLFMPKTKNLVVSEKLWNYNVNIEKYQKVDESDWTLPEGAENVKKKKEIHHYNQILDHYETKTRTYTERVQTGSHVEYTYSDNGDGTFKEHAHTVPDYENVTKTEEYQDPVYKNVPVIKTKYYYKIWRWKPFRDIPTSGKNSEPYFGDFKLGEKEREGEKTKSYSVTAISGKNKEKNTYKICEELWKKIKTDQKIEVKIQSGEIIEIVK